MHYEGSIRAVNLLIRDFVLDPHLDLDLSRTARFAQSRLAAKFEEPKLDTSAVRRTNAWEKWISFDDGLRPGGILGPHWAKARLIVHEVLKDFSLGELMFTNGSSFIPLGNRVSIACKLQATWTITPDCFDLFASISYSHRALKHAAKKRFKRYCTKQGMNIKVVNRKLWNRFKNHNRPDFEIYKFKLWCIVTFVDGNRWSTVPKNNLKDRSICLEPLCNMLVQRAVGLGVRRCLYDKLGIDLDHLADVHRYRISDSNVATIDLSDCSDAISLRLINYLLPKRVLNKVLASRSDMTLGPDDNYYVVKKVSSMGNGFTFDLMTLILTALSKSFDQDASVFGDDIICRNAVADDLIESLTVAGFVVNKDKTLINSDYRESCGSHYIDNLGYLTAFDLRWLKTPHDLIVACNKVAILDHVYGGPFTALRKQIWSCIPLTLLGATVERPIVYTDRPLDYKLDSYVRYGPLIQCDPNKHMLKLIRRSLKPLQKTGRISVARSIATSSAPARSDLNSRDWDVFFQYIHDQRLTRKIPRLVIKSTLVARVNEEQIGFVNALLP